MAILHFACLTASILQAEAADTRPASRDIARAVATMLQLALGTAVVGCDHPRVLTKRADTHVVWAADASSVGATFAFLNAVQTMIPLAGVTLRLVTIAGNAMFDLAALAFVCHQPVEFVANAANVFACASGALFDVADELAAAVDDFVLRIAFLADVNVSVAIQTERNAA